MQHNGARAEAAHDVEEDDDDPVDEAAEDAAAEAAFPAEGDEEAAGGEEQEAAAGNANAKKPRAPPAIAWSDKNMKTFLAMQTSNEDEPFKGLSDDHEVSTWGAFRDVLPYYMAMGDTHVLLVQLAGRMYKVVSRYLPPVATGCRPGVAGDCLRRG